MLSLLHSVTANQWNEWTLLILTNIRLLTIVFLYHFTTVHYIWITTLWIKFWISTWKIISKIFISYGKLISQLKKCIYLQASIIQNSKSLSIYSVCTVSTNSDWRDKAAQLTSEITIDGFNRIKNILHHLIHWIFKTRSKFSFLIGFTSASVTRWSEKTGTQLLHSQKLSIAIRLQ